MASPISQAFTAFLQDSVRLDNQENETAKSSKNWLIEQIKKFPSDPNFLALHPDISIDFGSYSRKTKSRPLDDIDIMIILHAEGNTRVEYGDRIEITVQPESKNQNALCFDNTKILNSRKVINKFKEKLADVPQYKEADIKRNQEAVTLELQSYPWIFDIVPCFQTSPINNSNFFLIPDGQGNWKKADPRIDKERIYRINQQRSISVFDMVRLVKYWNMHTAVPAIPSYLLEVMVLYYYQSVDSSNNPRIEFQKLLQSISLQLCYQVADPKGFQGDLNTLSFSDRQSTSNRAAEDSKKANNANLSEVLQDHKACINQWAGIFKNEFPKYEQ